MNPSTLNFAPAIVNQLTAEQLDAFLAAYHRQLIANKSFPPLTGNKPMHQAASALSFSGAEQLSAAMNKKTATEQHASPQGRFIFAHNCDDGAATIRLYNTRDEVLAVIRRILGQTLSDTDRDIQYILDNCGAFDSLVDVREGSDWVRHQSTLMRLFIATESLSIELLSEAYNLISSGGHFSMADSADPQINWGEDVSKGDSECSNAPSCMNTELQLMYRDASNYKRTQNVILTGGITNAQITALASHLDEGCQLISHEVGLPTPAELMFAEHAPSEDDHVYTTMSNFLNGLPSIGSLLTDAEPTEDMTITMLISALKVAPWDESAEMARLNIA